MAKWTAIVLTCASKNSSIAYQKELKLRQDKGLIDNDSLIICVEDPEKPIGSGGATLNALLVVAEALSARKKYRMTQVEVLKDTYILIMHMGRQYSFDLVAKGLSTLPLVEESTGCLVTNFDLLYHTMSYQIACFHNNRFHSDPGVYVCSTDMIFFMSRDEKVLIQNKPICVLASWAEASVAKKNGIYELNDQKDKVKNIYFQPDDTVLSRAKSLNGLFNLVSGIVYLDYEVTERLFSLLTYAPLDACSYVGIDSGASPLCLSIFFDIFLSCCPGITREQYLNGSFKTNHNVAANQLAILRQARSTLWQAMHEFKPIHVATVSSVKHIYMDNETFEHRRALFVDHSLGGLGHVQPGLFKCPKQNNLSTRLAENSTLDGSGVVVNSDLEATNLSMGENVIVVDSRFKACNLTIGENTYLSDLRLKETNKKLPANVFIQRASLQLDSLNVETVVHIVFGIRDNLTKQFDDPAWTIMNQPWPQFSTRYGISVEDLWPSSAINISSNDRLFTLSNAKLYPIFSLDLSRDEMAHLSQFFWLELIDAPHSSLLSKWKKSVRVSLEDIGAHVNLEKLLVSRRNHFNMTSTKSLVDSIVRNTPIPFGSLIRNSVCDGYAHHMLTLLEEAARAHNHDLILLPRIMIFISNILYEIASRESASGGATAVRSGPGLNSKWQNAFEYIESRQIEQGLVELSKERRNWMQRPDWIIRAARHYEGAMLAFIRLATACFRIDNSESSRIKLIPIVDDNKREYEWVTAESPARLDLAGAWSDTPPITYECPGGSCVTNVAILVNGRKPIGAKCRVIDKKTGSNGTPRHVKIVMKDSDDDETTTNMTTTSLVFTHLDELRDYNKPQAIACLMKACLVFTKLVELKNNNNDDDESLSDQLERKLGGSLELHTWTGLPHGSGLGTSSILAGCVLKALWRLMNVDVSNESLSYAILVVEQIMTTNGGWQDQVGSIWGGFKTTTAKNQLPLEIDVRKLNVEAKFLKEINKRLVLVYTGITRLAKDLLLNVLRNWYAISREIYDNVQELVKNGNQCRRALENGDLKEFGECINRHRAQKLIMAPESEPESVKQLISILEPHVYGIAMAGAGGGGFVFALTREPNDHARLATLVDSINLNMRIYQAQISDCGIELKLN